MKCAGCGGCERVMVVVFMGEKFFFGGMRF